MVTRLVIWIAFVVHDREKQRLALSTLLLYANRAIVFPCTESSLYILHVLLVELLIHGSRLSDLIDTDVLIKRCKLLLRLRVHTVPCEERTLIILPSRIHFGKMFESTIVRILF